MTLNPKHCELCGTIFQPTGPAARFCPDHSAQRRKAATTRSWKKYQSTHLQNPGVGKGGANRKYQDDENFIHGIAWFKRNRERLRRDRRFCERCSKDLMNAGKGRWAVHHRDHDRTNNVESNWELLCKRCHQLEHDCQANLLKAQRPSRKGVGDSVPEAHGGLVA